MSNFIKNENSTLWFNHYEPVQVKHLADDVTHQPVSWEQLVYKRYNLRYKDATTAAEQQAIIQEYNAYKAERKKKLDASKKKSNKQYWELDNVFYNKKSGRFEPYKKYVCLPDEDNAGHYKWTALSYSDIAQHESFKDLNVYVRDKVYTVSNCIYWHSIYKRKALDAKDNTTMSKYIGVCRDIKDSLDQALDVKSRLFEKSVKQNLYEPAEYIKYLDKRITDKKTFVACYPYKASHYHGEEQSVPNLNREVQLDVDYNIYVKAEDEYAGCDFILATNSDIKFGALLADSSIKTLIARAKVFDYTPRTVEGIYKEQGYTGYFDQTQQLWKRWKTGVRGMCVTFEAIKELLQVVEYYEYQAEQGNDMSPLVELHHQNGVDVKTITRYQYYKHREEYLEWSELELRDLQEPLYADDEEDERAVVEGYLEDGETQDEDEAEDTNI